MKKQNVTSLFKGKGFYVSLGIGAIVLAAIGSISYNMLGNQDENSSENQNQMVQEAVLDEKETSDVSIPEQPAVTQEASADKESDLLSENDDVNGSITNEAETTANTKTQDAAEEPDSVPVINTEGSKAENLHFNEDKGLLWPITGNVIMNYSMDSTIYFQTLAQYKCNPALIIAGDVGTDVFCAADGIVTDITENEETGFTVTTNVGDGYYIVYGQLNEKDLTVEVGDSIAEGNVIGTIAEPTKYYVVEGSNLYFQVLEGDDTVNPMLLLR